MSVCYKKRNLNDLNVSLNVDLLLVHSSIKILGIHIEISLRFFHCSLKLLFSNESLLANTILKTKYTDEQTPSD